MSNEEYADFFHYESRFVRNMHSSRLPKRATFPNSRSFFTRLPLCPVAAMLGGSTGDAMTDSTTLAAEAATLNLPRFSEAEAWRLGSLLVARALAECLPVVINIRTADRTLFHAALPGSAPLNDLWARRKSATALVFHEPSFLVGTRNREKGEALSKHGLDPDTHADHGGAVPVRVAGVGVVAVATVSGLPQAEDHAMVVAALRAVQAELG
jgi:uncharacterized protein (UPF0303 family)